MSKPSPEKDIILGKTLQILTQQYQLTPAEIGQIRLSNLHLAGKTPSLNLGDEGGWEDKIINLDLDAHRALVNWLVNRPDSISDYLFPGEGADPISVAAVEQALAAVESAPRPGAPSEVDGPAAPPPASRPVPPPSRPESGPSPAPDETMLSFRPVAPPEADGPDMPPPPLRPETTASRLVAIPPGPPEAESVSAGPVGETPLSAPESEMPASPDASPAAALPVALAEPKPQAKIETGPNAAMKETDKTMLASAKPPVKAGTAAMVAAASRPITVVPPPQRPLWARMIVPASAIVLVLLCGGCLFGGWFAAQSEPGNQLLASVGWSSEPAVDDEATAQAATAEAVVIESPLPTPTLPPTSTSTPLPSTNTPPPADEPGLSEHTLLSDQANAGQQRGWDC